MGWMHVGTEVFQDEQGEAHMCEPYIEDKNCSTQYKWKMWKWSMLEHDSYLGLDVFPVCINEYLMWGYDWTIYFDFIIVLY